MSQEAILLPMCALAFWTFIVLILVPLTRIRAARAGRVKVKDFRYGESPDVPGDVSLPNRDYMNLLELPVLFYVVSLAIYATKTADEASLLIAWAFVACRILHSIVHLAYNNVLHRMYAFIAGVALHFALWTRFALSLV